MISNYNFSFGWSYSPPTRITFRRAVMASVAGHIGRILLLCLTIALGASDVSAADVYLAQAAKGSGSGANWDNAKAFTTWYNSVVGTTLPNATKVYIKEGNYSAGNSNGFYITNHNILVQGGFPTSATGTDKSGYNPLLYKTVINITSTGSSSAPVFMRLTSSAAPITDVSEVKGLDVTTDQTIAQFLHGQVGSGSSTGNFHFTDLYVHDFKSAGTSGGGFMLNFANLNSGAVVVDNCLFKDNKHSAPVYGSATYTVPVTVKNSSFVNNETRQNAGGGAIWTAGDLTISNSYFCQNHTIDNGFNQPYGGAISTDLVSGSSTLTISNSTFYQNYAAGSAGAIYKEVGLVNITNTSFYDNYAQLSLGSKAVGGAILIANGVGASSSNTNIINDCIFYNNYTTTGAASTEGGGAVYIGANSNDVAFTNTKFVANNVPATSKGGAVYLINKNTSSSVGPDASFNNCLFYNNKIGATVTTTNGSDVAMLYSSPNTLGTLTLTDSQLQGTNQASYVSISTANTGALFVFSGTNTFQNSSNGGVTAFTGSCPTSINAVAVNVTGQVWDDVNGNVALDGSETGTNAGGPLYVNLVDGTGTVIASTTVSATGSYTLTAPVSTTGLKLVLTNSASSSTPGTLPSQWVNTGESVGAGNSATQSATLGQIELTTGTTDATAQNFGVEHLPTPGSGANTVPNAGGTSPVTVPANTFTNITPGNDNGDTPPGSVTAIHITSFPTNVTSLTINGTVYTSIPTGGITVPTDASGNPTVPILVDPTNDSQPVVFTYTAIDNAGKESTTTGTATLNFLPTLTVSGQVWDDVNGNVVFDGSENGTNAGGPLYVNLVDASGTVIASTTVSPSGSYSLTGVPTNTPGLKLVLASTPTATTPGSLPSQWVNTGDSPGPGNPASQGSTLGQIELTTGTTDATAQNFGIEHLPTPGSGTATVANPGGTSPVTAPPTAFTNTVGANDNGDTPPGSVTAIKLTVFPSNVTSLTVNGTVYTSLPAGGITIPTDANGAPSVPILVDPTNDTQPVVFTYTAIDNAGKESTTTGTATLNFLAVPDLTPIIYARPSTVYNTTDVTVVVDVLELLGAPTSGTIVVKLSKDALVSLVFPPTATSVGDKDVQNSVWSVNSASDPNYHILTTSQVVVAGDKLSFGFTGRLTPGATSGTLTLSSVIVAGSGGEVKFNNNVDADKIDYFQQ